MLHEIKIFKQFADRVFRGDKTFEIRENDRGYQKGDRVMFTVFDNNGMRLQYHPLNGKQYEINYVMSGWGLKNGFVVFGIKECLDSPSNSESEK